MPNLEDLEIIGKCKIFSTIQGDEHKCMDVEGGSRKSCAKIILYPDNGQRNQNFIIRKYNKVYFVLQAEHSKLVLDICGGKPVNGSQLIQYPFHGGNNQLFRFSSIDENIFFIFSKLDSKVLDIQKNTANHAHIILNQYNANASQRFLLKILSVNNPVTQNYIKAAQNFF